MYTIHEITSSWKFCVLSSLGGDPWAMRTANFAVIWLAPPESNSPVTINGRIWSGSRAETGDRPCVHLDANGTLIRSATDAVTWAYADVTGTVYVGPPVRRQRVTLRSGTTMSSYVPIFVTAGQDCTHTVRIPDHMKKGSRERYDFFFRDIYFTYTFKNNVLSRVTHYWANQRGYPETLTHKEEELGTVDPINQRYTLKSGSTSGLKVLTGTNYPISATPTAYPSMKEWNRTISRAKLGISSDLDVRLGDLCRRCADDARFIDVNNIEYLRDLSKVATDLRSVYQLLRGKATLKSAASLYLSGKYGVPLTVKDTIHLAETSLKEAYSMGTLSRRAKATDALWLDSGTRNTHIHSDLHYKITYRASDSGLLQFLSNWINSGFFPTLRTGWELIPFSFVVDWFVDVSSWLDQFDANTFWSTHKVIGATWSEELTISGVDPTILPVSSADCVGTVTVSSYRRYVQRTLHVPRFFLDTPREFKNYVELGAILIQRGKRH